MKCPRCFNTGRGQFGYPCPCICEPTKNVKQVYQSRDTIKTSSTNWTFIVKSVVLFLIAELACISSIAGAVFLAYHGKEGWGWLIVLAVLMASSSTFSKSKKSE